MSCRRKSYRIGMTWLRVNDERIFVFSGLSLNGQQGSVYKISIKLRMTLQCHLTSLHQTLNWILRKETSGSFIRLEMEVACRIIGHSMYSRKQGHLSKSLWNRSQRLLCPGFDLTCVSPCTSAPDSLNKLFGLQILYLFAVCNWWSISSYLKNLHGLYVPSSLESNP